MKYLYPPVTVKAQSFAHVKKLVIPNQSMSLKEILHRFIKREALPVARQGVYEERFGDLEKMSKMDIFDQMEKVEELKADMDLMKLKEQRKQQLAKQAAEKAATPITPTTGVGEPLIKIPPIGA